MAIEDGLLILRVWSCLQDIASLASVLHTDLLVKSTELGKLTTDWMCNGASFVLKAMQTMISKIDELVCSEAAMSVERQGVKLAAPLASLREWARCMSNFSGVCQAILLRSMSIALEKITTKCKAKVPAWTACFDDNGKLLESIAWKLMTPTVLSGLTAGYNDIHNMLSGMNRAAKALNVVPRLQEHEITADIIMSSIATMKTSVRRLGRRSRPRLGEELAGLARRRVARQGVSGETSQFRQQPDPGRLLA